MAKKTHCVNGHEFTVENTRIYINDKGYEIQICRACKREWYQRNLGLKEGEKKDNKNQNTDKTHCIRGHEFTPENTAIKMQNGKEHRICIICRNEDARIRGRENEARFRALLKSDPVKWEQERRSRREEQLKKIGWTLELFDKTWEAQGGKCAIPSCGKPLSIEITSKHVDKAYADHEHCEPPKPRGILCINCNLGIGNLQENIDIMEDVIAYIKKWG